MSIRGLAALSSFILGKSSPRQTGILGARFVRPRPPIVKNLGLLTLVLLGGVTLLLGGCDRGSSGPSDKPAKPEAGAEQGEGAEGPSAEGPSQQPGASPPKMTMGDVKPAKDDVLLLAYGNDPNTLNAITSNDTVSQAFQRQVYETLGETNYHNPDEILPSLAKGWEFDKEKLQYTIHLRKGVKWHPMRLPGGRTLPEKQFTSRDVKFTFDTMLNPHVEAAHIRSYFEDPEAEDPSKRYKIKVTVVDKYTVKVKWTKPYFLADEFTLGAVPIIPRHVYSVDENGEPISFDFSSKEFADGFNTHWANKMMCGTGPMRFKRWTRNDRLELVRFNGYWGAPYYFSRLIMRCIPNTNTMTQKVLQNELDFAGFPEKDQWLQAESNANVKSGKVKLIKYEYPGYRYIGYNLNRPIFQDKQFRWAMAHATPVKQIVETVFHGLAIPVAGPFLPGASACDPSIEPVPYDLDKARELLAEAGWKDTDGDGVLDKEIAGARVPAFFDLMIFSDSRAFKTIAEIYQENCRKIGVKVQISPAKWALMLEKLNSKEFDSAMLGWGTGWQKADPFQLWHGSLADVPSSSNFVAYRNLEVDELIDELRVTMDSEKQIELYHKIHRLIYDDQPYTFLFSELRTAGQDARIKNVHFYRIRPCVDSREWYSDAPRVLGK